MEEEAKMPITASPSPQAAKWVCARGRECLLGGRDPALKNHQIPTQNGGRRQKKEKEGGEGIIYGLFFRIVLGRKCITAVQIADIALWDKKRKTDNEAFSIQTTR